MPTLRTESQSASLEVSDLKETWHILDPEERIEAFVELDRGEAEDFFLDLPARDQAELLMAMSPPQRRSWVRLLPPDDAADVIQAADDPARDALLDLLDGPTRAEVQALLAYAEDDAGGLMNPRYARLRPDVSIDEAISYVRRQARDKLENLYYIYVIEADQKLLGVVSLRDLFTAAHDKKVREICVGDVVVAHESMDQEELSRLFAEHDLQAIPVVDAEGRMKGIVTVDDIVDVIQEEATEDIQKIGGTAALEAPYLQTGFLSLVKKRVGWLAVLFVGEMFTASAMGRFEDEIGRAVVLSLFIPLIISSGGNAGSQASTLVIRAMALGEVSLGDWWRVVQREVFQGVAMGSLLALIGFMRVMLWEWIFHSYGIHSMLVAATVAASVLGVVTFGTVAGAALPLALRRVGLDPASASAPFVATFVDVTGIIIYFTVASLVLRGTLL